MVGLEDWLWKVGAGDGVAGVTVAGGRVGVVVIDYVLFNRYIDIELIKTQSKNCLPDVFVGLYK